MLLADILARRVLFVGGKGGVGKTTVASALAWYAASQGRRVLVVSTDPAHNLGHLWGRKLIGEPLPVASGVDALEIDPDRQAAEHLAAVERTMRRLMPEHLHGEVRRHVDSAAQAPGTQEAALLEAMADVLERTAIGYDLVVFDTAPTGHTGRLLSLPETLSTWTQALSDRQGASARFGRALRSLGPGQDTSRRSRRDAEIKEILQRRGQRFTMLREVIAAPSTGFVVVLTPERLPVQESLELHRTLQEVGVAVAGLVVNRRSPGDAGELLAQRRAYEEPLLAELDAALPDVPRAEVPLQAQEPLGGEGLERICRELARW